MKNKFVYVFVFFLLSINLFGNNFLVKCPNCDKVMYETNHKCDEEDSTEIADADEKSNQQEDLEE